MDPSRKTRSNLRWPGFSWPKCSECGCQKTFICQVWNLIEQLNTHICSNSGSCSCNSIFGKCSQIEGRGLPDAARELTKLDENAILQVSTAV